MILIPQKAAGLAISSPDRDDRHDHFYRSTATTEEKR
jgi:hypothetical protein